MDPIKKVTIIDRDPDYCEVCSLMISNRSDYELMEVYSSPDKLLRNYLSHQPDIIIFELAHPAVNGILAMQKIKRYDPEVRILVNSTLDSSKNVFEAFAAGASGYLLKDTAIQDLMHALDQIYYTDGAPMSPKIAKIVVESFQRNPNSPLSWRETEILASLANGNTYRTTADKLNIGVETVKSHVKNIYSKLHASNKSEAIHIARKESLI